ncbi:hypothetical protein [Terriglobus sp.]|uniref:hypothetical protein n=1 Tax=Terriglobus sp. TaxID=1889013 RepID=UPI003AFF6A1F
MNMLKSLFTTENGLSKPIDARTHGIIDYCHATFFFTVALVCCKKNPKAAIAAAGTGAFTLVGSLLTDYPLGKKQVIPFAVHGAMDAAFAAFSFALPSVCGFSGTKAAKVFALNGVVESTVVALTDWDSQHARAAEHH